MSHESELSQQFRFGGDRAPDVERQTRQQRPHKLFNDLTAERVHRFDAKAVGLLRPLLFECDTQLSFAQFCGKVDELKLPASWLAQSEFMQPTHARPPPTNAPGQALWVAGGAVPGHSARPTLVDSPSAGGAPDGGGRSAGSEGGASSSDGSEAAEQLRLRRVKRLWWGPETNAGRAVAARTVPGNGSKSSSADR